MYPVQRLCQKSTRLLSECIHGLLGSAKYAMDAEQAWLGTEKWPCLLLSCLGNS